jgi:phenylpyruvate tautomerase PptA (4-oxalocrotonate tautomerase family)
MPLYTLTTRAGVLTDAAKAKLAGELTTLHAEFSGVPRNWVHVVFHDYAPGNGFTAGEPSATAALTLLIRTGRSPEYKRKLLQRLWTLFQTATGAPDDQIVIGIQEVAPSKPWRWGRSCRTLLATRRRPRAPERLDYWAYQGYPVGL